TFTPLFAIAILETSNNRQCFWHLLRILLRNFAKEDQWLDCFELAFKRYIELGLCTRSCFDLCDKLQVFTSRLGFKVLQHFGPKDLTQTSLIDMISSGIAKDTDFLLIVNFVKNGQLHVQTLEDLAKQNISQTVMDSILQVPNINEKTAI